MEECGKFHAIYFVMQDQQLENFEELSRIPGYLKNIYQTYCFKGHVYKSS
jgi:hypothetical protein